MKSLEKENNQILIEEVNRRVTDKKMIHNCETCFDERLSLLCTHIQNVGHKLVFLTGPSSSGKTTLSHRLTKELIKRGHKAEQLALDDFYRNREDLPVKQNGEKDYESIDAIDVCEAQRCFQELQEHGITHMPIFDFYLGKRAEHRRRISIQNDEFLVVEGIHALNPVFVDGKENTRLYAEVSGSYIDENGRIVADGMKIRRMRRLVRDFFYRSSPVDNSFTMFKGVLEGEQKFIFPFRDRADCIIDTGLYYELCVLSVYIKQLLSDYPADGIHRQEAQEMLEIAQRFVPVSDEEVPKRSVLREFLPQPKEKR